MKYKANTRRRAIEYEADLIKRWKENQTFEASVQQRDGADSYVFYDGPPFITGVPHHGTLLTSIIKDAVPRFWTMQGKKVERRWGWDCHGLPAEVFTEKKLGIQDKRDIGTKISLEEYITTCRDNMVQTGNLWEDTIDRIGRWVDFQGAYKTMDKEFMESVWWAFKTLYEKGKIYEGEKVLMYCTRDATPISKAEVAMDNSYQNDTDPSVYVKFKLQGQDKYLLAWTTTPWTLPSNSAIAVNQDVVYVDVEVDGQVLVVAKQLLEAALRDAKNKPVEYTVIREYAGTELVGQAYEPLFEPAQVLAGNEKAFRIWHADFVNDEAGTGIAHESPAYGEEDYELSRTEGFPWVMSTDENGIFTMGQWEGHSVWDINKQIAKELYEQGVVWRIHYITHEYPHCHRCQTKLMYRAHPSWFMDIDGQRTEMLAQNSTIDWHPEHIKHGRSEKTIESAPDWNLSRDRFWATPMPVWKGVDSDGQEVVKIIGSYAELEELSGVTLEDYHRPWIDDVTFTIDGIEYKRIEKVMDCWFESGSMPFAQYHYPFENTDIFEQNFPADFIVEYVPQVRAWFYYMAAVNVGLFGKAPFKHALVHGTLVGNDGRKMSKSFGNYTDPNDLMDQYSADSLRMLFLGSPLMNGEDFSLVDKDVADMARKISMVWNVYDFFTMYAEVDNWEWNGEIVDPTSDVTNVLDTWILSKVHALINDVENATKKYDLQTAVRHIVPFLDELSNWYVRRSRKRFWKSDDDTDKQNAYTTLHYVLVQYAHVLAPFAPFMADELYTKLTGGNSVHLQNWPLAGQVNELVISEMDSVRRAVNEGLSFRSREKIKVRQPLASVTVNGGQDLGPRADVYTTVLQEELNVKSVNWSSKGKFGVVLDTNITQDLKLEGIARELVRYVQQARKDADLDVDDRIVVSLNTDSSDISEAISVHSAYICEETLCQGLQTDEIQYAYSVQKRLGDSEITLSLEKQG